MELLNQTLKKIEGLNEGAMQKTKERIDNLIKPQRSLGKLEDIAIQLSGITGKLYPKVDRKAIIVMAADHGVCEEGISAAPQIVTKMMTSYIAKGLSGVCALASQARAEVITVDIGIASQIDDENVINKKVRLGTNNMTKGPAMTKEEAIKALEVGIEIATDAIKNGINLLGTGEMGIGNTTPSTAILAVMGEFDAEEITGIGANLPKEELTNKINVIKKAIEVNKPNKKDAIDVLAKIGGLDIAGMAGVMIAGAANKVAVVVDGYISTAAAIIATAIEPKVKDYLISSHMSNEKGASKASEILGLKPMLDMDMRLGEGSGAALAFNIIEAATFMNEKMITFQEAGIGVV
ncbi:nicotinate-nucleotide--dimethylbenzimidazole phosphoribosyltransferase [Crassaminicella thermophila]|uniref:Nicotinate-nucleotide--dimethylbenzimidazole phosphoribosyltransferase n=1 Tax=Crassaminicella thermophila TaxID=2599308 RepID=A0A5C0SAQ9_CRATE|nr:nicotinate-nucleotide--dimethylbenzimidazole phosphoribosyltransferase [Crassaminicella thermophila]QEK11261.1 nicotinate-nucleotide--dimethylbenzimidazole phosphoribosyltransferase [Crassaminicella thermophila]